MNLNIHVYFFRRINEFVRGLISSSLKPLGIYSSKHQSTSVLEKDARPAQTWLSVNDILSNDFKREGPNAFILLNLLGNLTCLWELFNELQLEMKESDRLIVVQPNTRLRLFFFVLNLFDNRCPDPGSNRLGSLKTKQLLENRGFKVRKSIHFMYVPLPGLNRILNTILGKFPGLNRLGFFWCLVAEPRANQDKSLSTPSVSVLVPTKNERENIPRIFEKLSTVGSRTEVIFVDGASTDGTRETILEEIRRYEGELNFKLVDQTETVGKGAAVRKGAKQARGDILIILDGDVSVDPAEIEKFYQECRKGKGRLVNGTRMIYPMEKDAMRPLNYYGNRFFAFVFTILSDHPITDTLCGTKALHREDYETIQKSRKQFVKEDPYGDFDLLLGAALHNFEVIEVPVKYHSRKYGETKINRFSEGYELLKMTYYAFFELKLNQ